MKKLSQVSLFAILLLMFTTSCDLLLTDTPLSEAEVADGLREALRVGTGNSVDDASEEDGYYTHEVIKILLPEEAAIVESTLETVGFGVLVDELVLKINRAAEDAAPEAQDIFVDAITAMTIEDAWGILNGDSTAATDFLRTKTYSDLNTLFKPKIENSLETVGANTAWAEVMGRYNSIPFVPDVDTDLAQYTTDKGLDGLFYLISLEEGKIRRDPIARVTELLQKVFGQLDN